MLESRVRIKKLITASSMVHMSCTKIRGTMILFRDAGVGVDHPSCLSKLRDFFPCIHNFFFFSLDKTHPS
jgi:hypothetical protein